MDASIAPAVPGLYTVPVPSRSLSSFMANKLLVRHLWESATVFNPKAWTACLCD